MRRKPSLHKLHANSLEAGEAQTGPGRMPTHWGMRRAILASHLHDIIADQPIKRTHTQPERNTKFEMRLGANPAGAAQQPAEPAATAFTYSGDTWEGN